ncbi:MAG: ABC transporter permease [Candidatus Bathyarchaeota archaeon]|nr:ABC transporter permease [Candidatus Bathyarchaeota archaeon]MCX8177040.1 ABC transporter permease [Candidatus Bathyarchaeota archaeon]MDW8194221.1 ABC transporter permease [Nitrososphaerota archaeon]
MSGANEYHPSMLRGLCALTVRELKKWLKDPVMILMLVLQPLIWMGLLGKSMNINAIFSTNSLGNLEIRDVKIPGSLLNPPVSGVIVIPGTLIAQQLQQMFSDIGAKIMQNTFGVTDYFSYMAVGMVSMIVMTTTMFSGMSIVWDRRLGFLDKVVSTPVPRAAIIFAKVLNATLRAIFQATVILALAYLLGLQLSSTFTLLNLLGVYAAIFLLGVGLSSVFIAFSLRSTRMERPMQIISLITMPLMFASNTFFPIHLMPDWIQAVASVNPLTYLTDAVRQLTILPLDASKLAFDFMYLSAFAAILAAIGIVLSWRYLTR